jgi:crotonobetainyl-CoA:carnitine CoA-transferase CaiB-like acyl-CoA transferase
MLEASDNAALRDVRILDLATFLAAPFAATLLSDFGAEVIKVEMPGIGDHMRRHARVYKGFGYWWLQDARNKKSITVDMHKPAGQEVIKQLVAVSDVVIENFRAGTLEKWNLGYEDLNRINPRIIMLRTTTYGQTGRYKNRGGMAPLGEATGGLRELVGTPSTPPLQPGIAWGDYAAAFFGALGIMIALHDREHTGLGQMIDTSLCESVFRVLHYYPLSYCAEGFIPGRIGGGIYGGAMKAKDGKYVYIAIPTNRLFARLAQSMGKPALIDDARFVTIQNRLDNGEALWNIIGGWVAERTSKEVEQVCDAAEVPVATVYNIADIFADPYFTERGDLVDWDHPVLGKLKTQGPVPKLSRTPGQVKHWGPDLGEHTQEVLSGVLGYSQEKIDRLKAEGAI